MVCHSESQAQRSLKASGVRERVSRRDMGKILGTEKIQIGCELQGVELMSSCH